MARKVGKTRLFNYFPLIIITTLKSIVYIVDTLTDRCCFSFSHWIYQNKFYHSLPAGVNIHIDFSKPNFGNTEFCRLDSLFVASYLFYLPLKIWGKLVTIDLSCKSVPSSCVLLFIWQFQGHCTLPRFIHHFSAELSLVFHMNW